MLKIVNYIAASMEPQGKHLKFPITTHPKGPYKHHLVVRVDTGADVNCMNEKTFNELFPEVELSVCPHEIQNFRNSVADISILGQFCTYLQFRGEKYEHFYSHQCQRLSQLTQLWCNFQIGCTTSQLSRGECCERRKCTQFQV